jgi:hypothetical protein
MSESVFEDSTYRFTDPIRLFKANDPYYFEVDNIPLKQVQENCNWLRDQLAKQSQKLLGVKRGDIDELRPFASGEDRVIRVKPGRYTARINDASTKDPLAQLKQVMGEAIGDVNAYAAALPNAGNMTDPNNASRNFNTLLTNTLDKFKSILSQNALGMNGLAERAFTWPVVDSNTPVRNKGVAVNTSDGTPKYAAENNPGGGAQFSPMVITQALTWAKSLNSSIEAVALPTYETTNTAWGFSRFPRTESFFIKRWRGVARLAVVDIDDEISVEIPAFDHDDFQYTNSDGTETQVDGVQSRIDLVFIYSKPVDTSGVNLLTPTGKSTITRPALGVVQGAGIKVNYQETGAPEDKHLESMGSNKILASPGDQFNDNIGFNSTSANDIAYDVRGSFPAPDDLLNLAPLISEKLEETAYELIGQSILPVAYVWVKNSGSPAADNSIPVLSTDVIDIRPLFRTAELAYNERAGIAAAFPQLSLANPAVGKAQMDYELREIYQDLKGAVDAFVDTDSGTVQDSTNAIATGYIFGGWNFGPEGALFDYYQQVFGADDTATGGGQDNPDGILATDTSVIKQYIIGKYGIGSTSTGISVPSYPDWDLSEWCTIQNIDDKGLYPNDYINTFTSFESTTGLTDRAIVAGSNNQVTYNDGTTDGGGTPSRMKNFNNSEFEGGNKRVNFHYVSKKIKFNRSAVPWLADYQVNVELLNCLPQCIRGSRSDEMQQASYFGHWIEKGFDEFTIYVAYVARDDNEGNASNAPSFPAPHSNTFTSGGKKKKTTQTLTLSDRSSGKWAGWIVPVGDILTSNTNPMSSDSRAGYVGNPRVGKCTYPTVTWKMTGIPNADVPYLYGNLNGTNPTINVKSN